MLTKEVKNHLTAGAEFSKKEVLVNNFLGGIAWGFGTVVGAAIVGAFLLWILAQFKIIPGLSDLRNSFNLQQIQSNTDDFELSQ